MGVEQHRNVGIRDTPTRRETASQMSSSCAGSLLLLSSSKQISFNISGFHIVVLFNLSKAMMAKK
jgi:hypothetical protein